MAILLKDLEAKWVHATTASVTKADLERALERCSRLFTTRDVMPSCFWCELLDSCDSIGDKLLPL